ncbi:thioredoxin domain-containing protein [uncultured Polaribacter sp.]|uniref:thioredoxin domain-containing protein n=1 Tax=uncultured Polaribacter sp. TaxID=174711 RepID=UPI002635A0CA|nr:thioredoxin domain-containing protein [uncultured Polaribacter sp.]
MKTNQIISKIIVVTFYCCLLLSCIKKQETAQTNDLIYETSPYLLQHAKNPVNWKAWNSKTLELAKKENKLMVISIGYSACHWCHVMEEESFENDTIAKLMNNNFINIKVDREERPDVDNIYMDAVQLMTGKGGWPLNCIALPNGKPVFGGTYFTKKQWKKVLTDIHQLYIESPEKLIEYAEKVTAKIQESGLITLKEENESINENDLKSSVALWKESFDTEFGGIKSDIKFPLPKNLEFLLRYDYHFNDISINNHLETSLTQMAYGGIFDQINGGFSRYATDRKWHIPHFEKMLYDNAQLVSLYSKAYQKENKPLYKSVIIETLDFIKSELTAYNGAFYSSLDADSKNSKNELEEGAYYYWTKKELQNIIKESYPLFEKYYNINNYGLWEKDRYVLIRNSSDMEFAKKNRIDIEKLYELIHDWKTKLKKERKKKNKPRLDDKVLTSWNALMISGYLDAYRALKDENYLNIALKNAHFVVENQLQKNGKLFRNYKNGKSTIDGYLEDYATLIEAFINLYEVTFDEKWLKKSKILLNYSINHFFNKENGMFYFTQKNNLISKKTLIIDGAISSPNSILANCLFKLGLYYSNTEYTKMANQMLSNIKSDVLVNPNSFSNWLNLSINFSKPFYEVAIVGNNAKKMNSKLLEYYLPNIIIAGSENDNSSLSILNNKFVDDETFIYVCNLGNCKLPQREVLQSISLVTK